MSDYLDKYDVASQASGSILGAVKNLTLATGVDIVTTLWNSLPLTPEWRTDDVLSNIDKDALAVYNESRDTVHTLSLIGGSVIPGAIGIKLLNRLRGGLESAGYTNNLIGGTFAGTRQKTIAADIEKIFAESGSATAAYKQATRNLYLSNIAKEAMDNAAIEFAVVGAMHSHPYMEDYGQDKVQNFLLGAGFGAAIGSAFAVPATRRLIMDGTGNIATRSLLDVSQAYRQVDESFTAAGRFQAHTSNIKRLGVLAADEKKNGLTRELAASYKLQETAELERSLEDAVPWINDKGVSKETKQALQDLLGDPRFIGVDKIRFYDLDAFSLERPEIIPLLKKDKFKEFLEQIKIEGTEKEFVNKMPIETTFLTPEGKAAVAFTRLSTGEIFAAKGARNAALAIDIKDIKKRMHVDPKGAIGEVATPVKDFGEDNIFRAISSASSDASFLRELKLLDKVRLDSLPHVPISPDHLPRMNALLSKLSEVPDEVRSQLKIYLRSDLPSYQEIEQFVNRTLGKNYFGKVKESIDRTKWADQNISEGARSLLADWIHGHGPLGSISEGEARMRRLMDHVMRGTALPKQDAEFVGAARELLESGEKTRAALRKHADADGFVYLYRGMRVSPRGSSPVESFTTQVKTAIEFAEGQQEFAKLYKVHIDNVIGSIGSGRLNEAEILVGAPHHNIFGTAKEHAEFIKDAPNALPTPASELVNIPTQGSKKTISPDKLAEIYADETERQIKGMVQSHFAIEEISARLNVKNEAVNAVIAGGRLKELTETGFEWRRYTDVKKIDDEYLHPKNKLYAIIGNPVKNQHAESMANLDARQLRVAHKEHIEQATALSGSKIANDALEIYADDGIQLMLDDLMKRLGTINNQIVGDPRWQSADNVLRKVIDGPILTYIGKQIINKADKIKKEILEPMANSWLPIKGKPEAMAEMSNVLNKMYGLEGWRELRRDPTMNFGYIVQKGKKGEEAVVKNKDGSTFYIEQANVLDALDAMRAPSNELLKLHNLNRSLTGRSPLSDLGFYVPPISLVNKSYAFVIDNTGADNVRLLVANSAPELEDLIGAFKRTNASAMDRINVVRKGEQADYNLAKGYTDYEAYTTYANVAFQHKGSSALAIVPSDSRFLENIMTSYENLILQGVRRYSETYLQDVTGWLDKLSAFYKRGVEAQPKLASMKESTKDSALTVKNIILGRDQLEQSPGLKSINTTTDLLLNRAYTALNNFTRSTTKYNKESYDEMTRKLNVMGVRPIWASYDEYMATTRAESRNVAPSIVSTGNGMLATLQLRMFEIAQASVNIMSLPILTWSALMERLPGTIINSQGDSMVFPLRVMYAGIRQMFSPEGRAIEKTLWEPHGHIDQTVRQYTETLGALKGATQSPDRLDKAMQMMTEFQDSKAVKLLSSPADFAERFTRRYAMHTGYWAAKQAYPGLSDSAATVAAVSFADRVIGNYHAAQRPTMFQGTFGAALGLYQTYFLTFAQHVYRGLEDRNFRQLAGLSAVQAGIFGIASWPGFNLLSEQIVSRFNDKHYDLTTGTFRAADKHTAELILYGFPSSLGPAFYTRGDISPRIPGTMDQLAIVNGVREGWNALHQIVKKTGEGFGDKHATQSLFEALSLQSINRPIARWSELVTGSSLTQQGNTVSPQNEVWSGVGIFARLLATRPIEEQVTRNARHLNTFYGQLDFERRQEAVRKLKTAMRDGSLNDELIGSVSGEYLRFGGTSKGWSAAVNEALTTTADGTRLGLMRKLEPDSPIMHMINDLY